MCFKATGEANIGGANVGGRAKVSKTPSTFEVFATILCLLSLVTYGIIGAQTQRASTVEAA
eukprot:998424-Karenia_brevis.AAC.1